jgi:hypothetical protein
MCSGIGPLSETTPIDWYVDRLSELLRGPRGAKRDLMAEARDALMDAAEVHAAKGSDREAAERQAVAEFGDVERIAAAYQAELGLAQARRTALLVVVILLAQPILWGNASRFLDDVGRSIDQAHVFYTLLQTVIEWLGAGTVLAALVARAAAGAGVRRIGVQREVARATGIFALGAAVVFVLLGIALTLLSPNARELIDAGAIVLLIAFLLAPMTAVAISAKSCLAAA